MAEKAVRSGAAIIPAMRYQNAEKAVEWLQKAFGFTEHAVFRNESGDVVHAELAYGGGVIMLGPDRETEFAKFMTTPSKSGGKGTQTVYCVVGDVDAHHARAKKAGAEILLAPKDQDYGGRDYAARDPEGHVWSFGDYDPWRAKAG
jgi:uncharacterized glyoxalase superfamily protein PhnB